jgi:superfamily II DNA or RNA helicase
MFKTSLKNYFAPTSRDKGAELYSGHSLSAFFPSSTGMTMRVLDHTLYTVQFEQIADKLWRPSCKCLDFSSTGACRHIWAALLYVDSEVSKKPSVKLWLKGQKIEAKIVAWYAGPKKTSARSPQETVGAGRDREEWEFFVDAMNEAVEPEVAHGKKSAKTRQLALVLNAKRSRSLDRLVFNLYARAGANERYKKTTVNAIEAADFTNDRKLLEFFLDLEAAHGDPSYPRTSLELNNLIFPRDRMKDWLQELSDGQKLFASVLDVQNDKAARYVDRSGATLNYITEETSDETLRLDMEIVDNGGKLYVRKDEVLVLCAAFVLSGRTIMEIPTIDERGKHWLKFMEDGLSIEPHHRQNFLQKIESVIPVAAAEELTSNLELSTPKPTITFLKGEVENEMFCEGSIHFVYDDRHALVNRAAEDRWRQSLWNLPEIQRISPDHVSLSSQYFPEVAKEMIAAGWAIYLDKKMLALSTPRFTLKKSRNWLELTLKIDTLNLDLAAISRSIKQNNTIIELSDGSSHLIQPKAQRTLARLLALLQRKEDSLFLDPKQIPLIDQMLSDFQPDETSAALEEYRLNLKAAQSEGPRDVAPSTRFTGILRPYQAEGLNWLFKMTNLSFGVCLADEMGLGKTIQILALLDLRTEKGKASLIVMPRSLVGNWKAEIARFVPTMKVLDYSGPKREMDEDHFRSWDLVLTTYGVLLREDQALMNHAWQHVILDEAQAIKNNRSQTAQAAHRLNAEFRVALSGTPLENNSSELVSLFRFLNPSMLGPHTEKSLLDGSKDSEAFNQIARSLRPFLLRRKKEDVVLDLPSKIINTLTCEMSDAQKKTYVEYLVYYKKRIAEQIAREGFGKSKLLMIEALLRLRQICCHPALVKPEVKDAESAKLDILMEKLEEIQGSSDKVLIFSQFTSFLRLIENRLVEQGIVYEYLDGQTKDRTKRVKRFQEDPEIKVFLISLKAGGVGLNLTAARYAFIMDPWWNPAVEEQAMARAHRIGQDKQVIIYKVLVKDSIEEKILDLQMQKNDLVREFMDGDEEGVKEKNLLQSITPGDLELLMS